MRLASIAKKVFGSPNDRKLKSVGPLVAEINKLESEFEALSDEGIKQKTAELKSRAENGEDLDSLLPEAFANAREAGKRTLGLRVFDVQLMGGIFLHRGDISEMKTGEGKTLVAVLPAYLNALTGKGVHIVTVNDYLARRDAEWMGNIYSALGVTVGVIVPMQDKEEKRAAYQADITYATNNELGFDYLRDNMATTLPAMAQRGHNFAIVDEVDSILIDEARTPLIISGPSQDRSELYVSINTLIPEVAEEHYTLDEKTQERHLYRRGQRIHGKPGFARRAFFLNTSRFTIPSRPLWCTTSPKRSGRTRTSGRTRSTSSRNDAVVLIDEFTGRMMPGRRLSEGLHQAIEAKENVAIQPENVTMASITFQNYFRLYDKLAGMTGTAATEAEEFQEIYGLGVVEIPTNRPVDRADEDDQVYRTTREKYDAILSSIREANEKEQPVLVGTTSIEKSEILSKMLDEKKISHNVLNARHHEQEAKIIADAGKPGAVTIATNMAGRGTDIQLGGNVEMRVIEDLEGDPDAEVGTIRNRIEAEISAAREKVLNAGGLYVLATERHESRRIDNQLRGRSGRQGDPGRSSFFLSLEDDLMRIFGSQKLDKVLNTLGMEDGEAIIHPWVNKSLEKAQAKVEARNFDIRKQLLKYDDVMNDQRKAIFRQRREIMESDDVSEIVRDMRHELVDDLVEQCMPPNTYSEQWEMEELASMCRDQLGIEAPVTAWGEEDGVDDQVVMERLYKASEEVMAKKSVEFGTETMRTLEKQVLLHTIDSKWREHLVTLEHLRSVIGFRGYAQRDPLNEFKSEAFGLFDALMTSLRTAMSSQLSKMRPITPEERAEILRREEARLAEAKKLLEQSSRKLNGKGPKAAPAFDENDRSTWGNPGRNSPCPCGSKKKFKHCHGRI